VLLSKAERDYLTTALSAARTADSQIGDGYSRVIKSRLQKKV
jgi:hypothetical protein